MLLLGLIHPIFHIPFIKINHLIAYFTVLQIDMIIYYHKLLMKPMLVFLALLILTACQDTEQPSTHDLLSLDTPHQKELLQAPFTGRYIFNIDKAAVDKLDGQRWFFFVEVEPSEEKEWVASMIDLSVGPTGNDTSKTIKKCDSIKGGVDSCFLTNKQFDYSKEVVHVKIRCFGPCKFKLSGEISNPYKLEPGKTVKMDFENTAYSQVFSLDTTKESDFDQLRVILRPEGFLQFPAPIGLYLNKGDSVPTKEVHDYKGMTLWDNGQGIFLDAPLASGTFTILIEGPEKNVLLLETMLVSLSETNNLPENLPFFDFLGQESTKKYQVKINPAKGVCLQMSTFSGAIKLLKIYDQELNEIDEEFPPLFRPYGELEYQLDAAFFTKNKKKFKIDEFIIFQLEGVKESTFVLESYQLNQGINHLLPERTRYLEIPAGKTHQYYIQQIELADKDFKKAEFQVILTTEEAVDLKKRVLHCKKQHGLDCEMKTSELGSSTIKNPSLQEISYYKTVHEMNGVQVLKFDIPATKFSPVANSTDVKKYIVVLTLQNKQSSTQLYTIQYINSGKSVHLREGEVRTDRISLDQCKYYSFTNTNQDVKEIRAHLMEISGRVVMEGFWKDPRQVDQTDQSVVDYHNSVRFEGVKRNQTVYLKVTGQESAYFSVQLQLMKEGERQWWHKNSSSSSKGYNEIIIVEDIAYEFAIAPKSKEVYQIHSKQRKFLLDMTAHLPLELCMTEKLTQPPFAPNCQEKETLTKNKIYDVTLERGNIANVGVRNSNDKEVKFNIRFTTSSKPSEASNSTALKCLPSPLGKINKYNLKFNTSACYSYFLQTTDDDLEVMVDVLSDQYNSVNVIAQVNGVERVEVIGATHIFKKAELQKACEKSKPCPLKLIIQSKTESEIRFSAQFMGGTFFLLDGIANQFAGTQQTRSFVYELFNKVNTTVILQNRNGFYKFYGKVVEAAKYWSGDVKFPTAQDKLVESSNPFYYLYQISVLSQEKIKAAKCEECLLLISVVREKESFDQGQKSKFIIEVTQEDRYLKDGQPVFSFLQKKSVAFFQYYNSQNGSILVSVGTQNQDCVQVYIKKGSQVRASGSDFDKKTETSSPNTLVYENAAVGDYSIMAEATENCYFSIDVTAATDEALSTIQRGHYKDITLGKDETAKFIFQNNGDTIKLLTLHLSGELTISAKAFPSMKALIASNLTKTKYQWSGSDFLRIDKEDKEFCATCVYLIAVKAEKQTKTTVMIPDGESEFPIVMDSSIKDELKAGEVEQLRIFTQRIQQFQVKVQYGTIKIQVISSHGDKVEFSETYEANKATQYGNISTSQNDTSPSPYPIHDYSFMRYSKVKITAIKNAGFSFGFISDKQESKRGNRVKYGVPEYVNLVSKKRECLQGTLNDKNEEFLISITGDKQEAYMKAIEISCKVGKQLLELHKDIAKSEMIVSINKPPATLPAAYEFCMLSNQDVFLTFIHSSNLNYFPQNKALMVSKEMNLTFYAEGKSLIEVNECRSRAIISISHSFNTLGGINSQIRQVRKTNNIIEFSYYGPVYLHVEAASATVAWRKKDQFTKVGRGYDQYTSNKIRLDRQGIELKVEVFPLKKVADKPAVTLTNVDYTVFLAEEEMNLYDAINCNHGTYLQKSISSKSLDGSLSLTFDVGQVLKTFGDKKYILVGVLATAGSNIDKDSNYRFIYPYQQILISALKAQSGLQEEQEVIGPKPNKETTVIVKQDSGFTTFVLYFTLIVVLGFAGRWVYRKWVKKFLKRRRQQLSEQGTGEVRYQEFSSYT